MNRLDIAIKNYGEVATKQSKFMSGVDRLGYYKVPQKTIIKKGVGIKTIRQLSKWDPSGNNKYLDWILNRKLNTKTKLDTLKDFVSCFHKMPHKFRYSDIYKYKTDEDITTELTALPNRLSKSEIKMYGAILIAETDQYKIVIPKTHMAAKMYGSGTKWCLTAANPSTFNSYYESQIIYFCIVKDHSIIKIPNDMHNSDRKLVYSWYHKLAISFGRHNINHLQIWDAKDNPFHNLNDLPYRYSVDFYTICRNHYLQHVQQNQMSYQIRTMKQQFINEFQHKNLPTYNDNIVMFDKIIENLEES